LPEELPPRPFIFFLKKMPLTENKKHREKKEKKKKKRRGKKKSLDVIMTDELSVSREYGKRLSNGGTWLGGWVIKGGSGSH
jgi:hypothetical protein